MKNQLPVISSWASFSLIPISKFLFPILRFFLFEEAAECVYSVSGILRLLLLLSSCRGPAGAAKLRLEQACRSPADVGDKFRIGGRAGGLKRNASSLAPALASADGAPEGPHARCRRPPS